MSDTHKPKLSPFLEGVARTFDLAGSFDEITHPIPGSPNPVADDWRAISDDYNKSITIINGKLNEERKKSTGK
jgi:hypothetical protein